VTELRRGARYSDVFIHRRVSVGSNPVHAIQDFGKLGTPLDFTKAEIGFPFRDSVTNIKDRYRLPLKMWERRER